MTNEIDIYWLRRHLFDEIFERFSILNSNDYDSFDDFSNGVGMVLVSLTDLTGVNFGNTLVLDPDGHIHIGDLKDNSGICLE